MKLPQLALAVPLGLSLLVSGCDRGANQADAQRLAEERAAFEREKAALAADKAAAQQAENDAERAKLEADRAALNREKERIAAQRDAQAQADLDARERDARMVEQRANQEAAARREAEARERAAQENARDSADRARAEQTVSFFYDALDPYGDWVEVDRYGYAFVPNAARSTGWRPYTDGGWVYTDYGWTWRSNEPFGWATYHYGRWARVARLGWVWVPGTEWGPAWVSWRRSSDYVGWAPLPPDAWSARGFNASVDNYFDIGPALYTFLRVVDFGEPTYVGRVVQPEQNVTIINQTTNVTNVVYKTVQNRTTIVNEGPDLTVINQRARQPVRRMAVERVANAGPQPARVQGNTLQLAAPDLTKGAAQAKPKQVKGNVKAAELDRGWAGAKADESRVRGEAAREAREAERTERGEPKATPQVKPMPQTPLPRPDRPSSPNRLRPAQAPEIPPAPPAPERPVKPQPQPQPPVAVPPAPAATPSPLNPTELTPSATPEPGKLKPGKMNRPTVPGGEDAIPEPHGERGKGKRPDAARSGAIPWNRPEKGEGTTPTPNPAEPTPVVPESRKPKKHQKD